MATATRRRVLRPAATPLADHRLQIQLQRKRSQLEKERATFNRWLRRVRRAFHAVEKQQAKIARIERQLADR